jgi:GR25 family glycosyltransferase involved in LPS biosynthesis
MIVINLPERTDRLEKIKEVWKEITVENGQRHHIPHTGCGLSHINAARRGLKGDETVCVIEDDIAVQSEFDAKIKSLSDALIDLNKKNEVHAIVVDPYINKHVSKSFVGNNEFTCTWHKDDLYQLEPNGRLVSTHCVIWHRSALKMLDDYEEALRKDYFLPIDRLLMHNQCIDCVKWEPCFQKKLPCYQNVDFSFPNLKWNVPSVLVTWPGLTRQRLDTESDNTGEVYPSDDFYFQFKDMQVSYTQNQLRVFTKLDINKNE